jgi:DNA-binding NtrC family response regulator
MKQRILIVSEEPDLRESWSDLLEKLGVVTPLSLRQMIQKRRMVEKADLLLCNLDPNGKVLHHIPAPKEGTANTTHYIIVYNAEVIPSSLQHVALWQQGIWVEHPVSGRELFALAERALNGCAECLCSLS